MKLYEMITNTLQLLPVNTQTTINRVKRFEIEFFFFVSPWNRINYEYTKKSFIFSHFIFSHFIFSFSLISLFYPFIECIIFLLCSFIFNLFVQFFILSTISTTHVPEKNKFSLISDQFFLFFFYITIRNVLMMAFI